MGYKTAYAISSAGVIQERAILAATPGTIEYTVPKGFHITLLDIAVQGDDTTDAATHLEEIRQIETIELVTKTEGTVLRIDGGNGLDTFNYAKIVTDREYASTRQGGDAANEESVIEYYFPFGRDVLDPWFPDGSLGGIPDGELSAIRIAWGSDTNVGMDSRQATIIAHGYDEPTPSKYRSTIVDSYTTVADESVFRELPAGDWLAQVYFFATTEWDADTANTRLAVEQFHLNKARTQRQFSWNSVAGLWGSRHIECADPRGQGVTYDAFTPVLLPEFYSWKLDMGNRGEGHKIGDGEFLEQRGGTAEAARVYKILWTMVGGG